MDRRKLRLRRQRALNAVARKRNADLIEISGMLSAEIRRVLPGSNVGFDLASCSGEGGYILGCISKFSPKERVKLVGSGWQMENLPWEKNPVMVKRVPVSR